MLHSVSNMDFFEIRRLEFDCFVVEDSVVYAFTVSREPKCPTATCHCNIFTFWCRIFCNETAKTDQFFEVTASNNFSVPNFVQQAGRGSTEEVSRKIKFHDNIYLKHVQLFPIQRQCWSLREYIALLTQSNPIRSHCIQESSWIQTLDQSHIFLILASWS